MAKNWFKEDKKIKKNKAAFLGVRLVNLSLVLGEKLPTMQIKWKQVEEEQYHEGDI